MTEACPVSCLVATDLSARSDRALVRAFRIASRGGGRVVALHVVEEDYPPRLLATLRQEVHSALHAQIAAMPESRSIQWEVRVENGHDYERIGDVARRQTIDLLVLGGRRAPRFSDLFLASTAQRVVRHSPVPVLIVKTPYRGPYGSALAAVDTSQHSREAIAFALRTFPELLVTAFHAVGDVWRGERSDALPAEPVALTPQDKAMIETPLRPLPGFAERGTFSGYAGSPGEVLAALAGTVRPDLLICGQSKSARSFFLGEDLPGYAMVAVERDLLIMP